MSAPSGRPSTLTKMRQAYWEAKQSFNKSLGQLEDDFIVSSDNDLDARIELLQAADSSFNTLMRVILNYRRALQNFVDIEESFGLALIEYGKKDSTAAGKIMSMSGKTISKAAQRQIQFKASLIHLFQEVQTFQFKATSDALKTASKMEKARKSYRSGLMWLKNESTNLDPDISKRLRNFRKVQEHVKRLKVIFDGMKLESMQKIDLYLLSRSNLFSNTLVSYNTAFKKICRNIVISMDYTVKNIPLCLSYNFVALKELNEYSKMNTQHTLKKEKQSSEQISKKERYSIEKSKRYSVSDELANMHEISGNSVYSKDKKNDTSKFGDNKNNNLDSFPDNCSSLDIPLIDFNHEENSCDLLKLLTENENPPSPKYSDDLRSINFDKYQTAYEEVLTYEIGDFFEHPLMESDSQGNYTRETDDLKFWPLIQGYDRTSSLKDNAAMVDSDLICPKHPSSNLHPSNSKWDDILIQFDPFSEERVGRKIKNDCLELC